MTRPISLFLYAVANLLTATVVSVRADTLVLANGDRLSGELVRHADGVIVFRSAVLGEISVADAQASIATPEPVVAVATTDVRPAVAVRDVATTTATRPVRHVEVDDATWKRQIELGLSAQDGLRDQSNLSVRLEAARTSDVGSTSVLVSHHYGKSDGLTTSDSTSANALLTRNLSEDVFVRGATRFDRDPVAGLDHAAEQSLGLGYTLLDNRAVKFSVGAGAAVRHRDTHYEPTGWKGLVDAFGRVRFAFNERLSLAQDLSLTAAPADRDDYKVKSQTALVNKLTDVLQMTVRYEFEYYGAASSAIAARQRFVTAIGCVF